MLVCNLLAEELLARRSVATAGLGIDCLAAVLAEPSCEGSPSVVDVVGHALRVGAPVGVQLMISQREQMSTYELSESRYLWTSKIRPVVDPSGLVTFNRAGPEPLETKVWAEA